LPPLAGGSQLPPAMKAEAARVSAVRPVTGAEVPPTVGHLTWPVFPYDEDLRCDGGSGMHVPLWGARLDRFRAPTVTVSLYYAVAGGVPGRDDVRAAIHELETLEADAVAAAWQAASFTQRRDDVRRRLWFATQAGVNLATLNATIPELWRDAVQVATACGYYKLAAVNPAAAPCLGDRTDPTLWRPAAISRILQNPLLDVWLLQESLYAIPLLWATVWAAAWQLWRFAARYDARPRSRAKPEVLATRVTVEQC